MTFNNGDKVSIQGRTGFTICGKVQRSYVVKDANGKQYKCTARRMQLVERASTQTEFEVKPRSHLETMVAHAQIFDKSASMPTDAESCRYYFQSIEGQLSPENLHCDGEISHSQAMKKKAGLIKAWRELEKIQGKKQPSYEF